VSGIPAPADFHDTFQPPELKDELLSAVPDYNVDVAPNPWKKSLTWESCVNCLEARRKAAAYLLRKFSPDLFIVVFTILDRVQHLFWEDTDPSHPMHPRKKESGFAHAIPHTYELLDRAVGELLSIAGNGVRAFIVSDHGFTPYKRRFNLNLWLRRNGYLHYRRSLSGAALNALRGALSRARITVLVRRLFPMTETRAEVFRSAAAALLIDWKKTTVYATPDMRIRVNLRGREPEGVVSPGAEYARIVDELVGKLKDAVIPDTGERVFRDVLKREQVVSSAHAADAPDVFAFTSDPSLLARSFHGSARIVENIAFPEAPGTHDHDGVFIAAGPGIARGVETAPRPIHDAAPTILYSLNAPIPENMDGKPMAEIFDPGFLEANPPASGPPFEKPAPAAERAAGKPEEPPLTPDEERELERRLRGLGYID
ncbi:MAG: alkaline phosphatase family protein, partial [bacterium]